MKTFLKEHGKKVSVGLLATALMATPMLNIVSAADGDTCERQNVYLFNYADVMKTEEYPYSAWKEFKDGGEKETDRPTLNNTAYVQFTDKYASLYGWNNASKSTELSGKGYDLSKVTLIENGAAKALDANPSDVTAGNYSFDGNPTGELEHKTSFDWNLDDSVQIVKEESISSWDDEDIDADIQLEKLNVNGTDGSLKPYESGNKTYFMHGSWGYTKGNQFINGGDFRSITFNKVKYLVGQNWAPSQVATYRTSLKNALINGSDTKIKKIGNIENGKIEFMIDRKLNASDVNKDNLRWYNLTWRYKCGSGSIEAGTCANSVEVLTDEDGYVKNAADADKTWVKTEYWIMVPAKYVVTYKDPNCKITGEETKEENADTGVASYAIIGTLLVGAASAYIYARKNNKFNKV